MRVIFAGTPEFARVALERLHTSGHTIALVLTQPDRPAGRGLKLQPSAVKEYALAHGMPVAQPRSLRLDGKFPDDARAARNAMAQANAEVMVVAAYGLILPQWVLDDMAGVSSPPNLGCLNIHGSLLPRWRGAAPIHRAIEAGDLQTGVTIMQMDAGLDTGAMLLAHSVDIGPHATTGSLHDQLALLGADLVVQALDLAAAGRLVPRPQPTEGVTYAHKLDKSESVVDWTLNADVIVRKVRAFDPFPVATTQLRGEVLKIWAAHADGSTMTPSTDIAAVPAADANAETGKKHGFGCILAVGQEGIAVAAMNSIAVITELQRPGGKRLPVAEFLRGHPVQVGEVMG